jgi:hypothetical protein
MTAFLLIRNHEHPQKKNGFTETAVKVYHGPVRASTSLPFQASESIKFLRPGGPWRPPRTSNIEVSAVRRRTIFLPASRRPGTRINDSVTASQAQARSPGSELAPSPARLSVPSVMPGTDDSVTRNLKPVTVTECQ